MTDNAAKVFEMMKAMDFCMLVTRSERAMRARPMSTIIDEEARTVHMLTSVKSTKDDEIERNPEVLLTFSNGPSKNVVLRGRAQISNDRDLIERLWNVGAQAFWPKGPSDPEVVPIAINPIDAEYWEGDGAVVSAFKFAAALAVGRPVDAGENEKAAVARAE